MRLIAARLFTNPSDTYVDRELISRKFRPLPPPKTPHHFHVYCSKLNPGALGLLIEVAHKRGFSMHKERAKAKANALLGKETSRRSDNRNDKKMVNTLFHTTSFDQLRSCDHMLLLLTAETWTRGDESDRLAAEVAQAKDLGVHVLLAHEMPGVEEAARHGCEFGRFFACENGATCVEAIRIVRTTQPLRPKRASDGGTRASNRVCAGRPICLSVASTLRLLCH